MCSSSRFSECSLTSTIGASSGYVGVYVTCRTHDAKTEKWQLYIGFTLKELCYSINKSRIIVAGVSILAF